MKRASCGEFDARQAVHAKGCHRQAGIDAGIGADRIDRGDEATEIALPPPLVRRPPPPSRAEETALVAKQRDVDLGAAPVDCDESRLFRAGAGHASMLCVLRLQALAA